MIDICGQISYNYSNLFQKKQIEVLSLNSYVLRIIRIIRLIRSKRLNGTRGAEFFS